jgi:hypothetical protein
MKIDIGSKHSRIYQYTIREQYMEKPLYLTFNTISVIVAFNHTSNQIEIEDR